jgi:hypothetical protein
VAMLVPVHADNGTLAAGFARRAAETASPLTMRPSHHPSRLPCPSSVLAAGQARPSGGIL